MLIEISNQIEPGLDALIEDTLRKGYGHLLAQDIIPAGKAINFSLAVVDKLQMQKLNAQYRKKDEPTDVLSFQYEDSASELEGEIIICLDIIAQNAQKDGIDFEVELRKNLIHGFLHNLGYGHGKEMFDLQQRVLDTL